MAGLSGTRLRSIAGIAVAAVLACAATLAFLGWDLDVSEEWKGAVDYVVARARVKGDPILVDNSFHLMTVEWHLQGTPYAPVIWDGPTGLLLEPGGSVNEPGGPWPKNIIAAIARRTKPGATIWIIERYEHQPDDEIVAYLKTVTREGPAASCSAASRSAS